MIQQHKAIIQNAISIGTWLAYHKNYLSSIFGNNQAFTEVFVKFVEKLKLTQRTSTKMKIRLLEQMKGTLGFKEVREQWGGSWIKSCHQAQPNA